MIKGLIRGEGIVFNAADFMYAAVEPYYPEYEKDYFDYKVIIVTKTEVQVVAFMGHKTQCMEFLDNLTLEESWETEFLGGLGD